MSENIAPNICGEDSIYMPTVEPCNDCDLLREEFTQALEDAQAAARDSQTYANEAEGYLDAVAENARRAAQSASESSASAELARGYAKAAQDAIIDASDWGAIRVTIPEFSALPVTITNSAIEEDMFLLESVLSNPSAQTSDWEVNTSVGSLTLSGSINGTTNAVLTLIRER